MPEGLLSGIGGIATTFILPLATLFVLWLGLRVANRTLTRSVTPQVECFLRPRRDSKLLELVIANFGLGSAYNVSIIINADEDDFKAHNVYLSWRSTSVPFSIIEPGGSMDTIFGISYDLFGDETYLKPFEVIVNYQWKPFWYKKLKSEKRKFNLDIRPFASLRFSIQEGEISETLKKGLKEIAEAIKTR